MTWVGDTASAKQDTGALIAIGPTLNAYEIRPGGLKPMACETDWELLRPAG